MQNNPTKFSLREVDRYARHIVMPQIGGKGQRALKQSKVLVVGAGGLGSPALVYLTLAGVGNLGVVDFDVVSISNLQRQILYEEKDVDKKKTSAAIEMLQKRNSDVAFFEHKEALTKSNAKKIVEPYDVVVNGADNFATRYLVNDVCRLLNKPLVDGAALKFEGHITTYTDGSGCYRCLFPSTPSAESAQNCATAGVLGAVVGVVGSMQAIEVVKLITKVGKPLFGRYIVFDAENLSFSSIKYKRRKDCITCGVEPKIDL